MFHYIIDNEGCGESLVGIFNRRVAKRLSHFLGLEGIPFTFLVTSENNVPKQTRIRASDTLYLKSKKQSIIVSICSDENGFGFDIYSLKGCTLSNAVADVFKSRIEGSRTKFGKQQMLRGMSPAIVIQSKVFTDWQKIDEIAKLYFEAIKEISDM